MLQVNLIHIDHARKKIIPTFNADQTDIINYSENLFEELQKNQDKREFKFISQTKEVFTLVKEIYSNINKDNFENIFEKNSLLIGERLLDSQIKTDQRYHFDLQNGSLIQLIEETDNEYIYILAKVEFDDFLDEENLKMRTGINTEEPPQKSCVIHFLKSYDDSITPLKILVSDSNKKIASYWKDGFLELKEVNTDDYNTRVAFKSYDKLLKKINRKSKLDYINLRNNLVGYFQTKSTFLQSDFIDYVVGEYEAKSNDISIEKIKNDLISLSTKQNFDRTFNIAAICQVSCRIYFHS